jgi:hypothetical protein
MVFLSPRHYAGAPSRDRCPTAAAAGHPGSCPGPGPWQPGRVRVVPAQGQYRASLNPVAAGAITQVPEPGPGISSWRPAPPMRRGTPAVRSRAAGRAEGPGGRVAR